LKTVPSLELKRFIKANLNPVLSFFTHIVSRLIVIFFFHLGLGLPTAFSLELFEQVYFTLICATCSIYVILLELITQKVLVKTQF
jgi:hypothetical protein